MASYTGQEKQLPVVFSVSGEHSEQIEMIRESPTLQTVGLGKCGCLESLERIVIHKKKR